MSAVIRAILQDYFTDRINDIDSRVDISIALQNFKNIFGPEAYSFLVRRCLELTNDTLPDDYYDFFKRELEIDDITFLQQRTPRYLSHLLPLFVSFLERIKN